MNENNQKRILFFSTPAYGHMMCVGPVLKRLAEEGYCVDCYSTPTFRDLVFSYGVHYVEYAVDFESISLKEITSDFFVLMKSLLDLNRQAYLTYHSMTIYDDVDLILYDSMCSFAKNIAYQKKIPSVCFVTTLAFNCFVFLFGGLAVSSVPLYLKNHSAIRKALKEEKRFRSENGIPKLSLLDLFMNTGDETVVFSPKQFQPFSGTFKKSIHFVGTTVRDRNLMSSPDGTVEKCCYYISLGTIFTENRQLLEQILKSNKIRSGKTVLVTGKMSIDTGCGNIVCRPRVNQIGQLQNCKIFINHGGINSVYESIYFGVLQICIPQQEEQRLVSKIVARKKLGIYRPAFDEKSLDLIENPKFTAGLARMSEILHQMDGTGTAVAIIKNLIKEHDR
ncbi:MAG: hypothetical protein ACI3XR_05080 [Eubacteriales bacterium]